jgi:SARP family transcriptional regulator, regulator of embCAB operon
MRILLLGGFKLLDDHGPVVVSAGSERLLAFLALHRHALRRVLVAGTLWPGATERRAYASLRSALVRLDSVSRRAVQIGPLDLSLARGVAVDLDDARAVAQHLLDPTTPLGGSDPSAAAMTNLSVDLLPGWYDDWVLLEAEVWYQLRLHALERLAHQLTVAGRFAEALGAACAAVRAEPLRESAHAVLIRVHLAEGNQSEALRVFARYTHLLKAELGLEPTPQLRTLVAKLIVPSRSSHEATPIVMA